MLYLACVLEGKTAQRGLYCVVGLAVTIFLSFWVSKLVRYIRGLGIGSFVLLNTDGKKTLDDEEKLQIQDKLKAAFEPLADPSKKPKTYTHNRWLGFMEATLAFVAFHTAAYELIAGWLAFKLTSKWQTSSTIIKYPPEIEGLHPLTTLRARNLEGANTLQRWLIGTLGNILAGMIGLYIAKELFPQL